ncbi:MAG: RND transporter [Nitrospirota bacterium]|jgi:hypothetical protein
MEKFMEKLTWDIVIILCLTLGLAPYKPPHIWEKLQMLFRGKLVRPLDWFDLLLHGIPWLLLLLKGLYSLRGR